MIQAKPRIYIHEDTGEVVTATKSQSKYLPDQFKRAEFTKNDEGTPVLRIRLKNATVDISENGEREVLVDGNGNTI